MRLTDRIHRSSRSCLRDIRLGQKGPNRLDRGIVVGIEPHPVRWIGRSPLTDLRRRSIDYEGVVAVAEISRTGAGSDDDRCAESHCVGDRQAEPLRSVERDVAVGGLRHRRELARVDVTVDKHHVWSVTCEISEPFEFCWNQLAVDGLADEYRTRLGGHRITERSNQAIDVLAADHAVEIEAEHERRSIGRHPQQLATSAAGSWGQHRYRQHPHRSGGGGAKNLGRILASGPDLLYAINASIHGGRDRVGLPKEHSGGVAVVGVGRPLSVQKPVDSVGVDAGDIERMNWGFITRSQPNGSSACRVMGVLSSDRECRRRTKSISYESADLADPHDRR